jgi:diguanylate cyclase
MISDLFVNVTILISFTFVWHQAFRNNRLTFQSPIYIKIADGVISGLLGILLMHYSISVNDITILDLRHIPLILVAFYGGFIPTLLGASIIAIGRFMIDVNYSSVVAFFMVFAMAIGAGCISKYVRSNSWGKWTYLLLYSQFIFTLALYIVVDHFHTVLDFAFNHIISSIIGGYLTFYFVQYIRKNSELYIRYKEFSRKDFLTGLNNVRTFDFYFNKVIDETKEKNSICCLCLFDIDLFKQINDTYGHKAGDSILVQFAKILQNTTRAEDIVSRNGGEEFSVLFPSCSLTQAKEIAERVRKKVEEHEFEVPGKGKIKITISAGVAEYNPSIQNKDQLIEYADDALYLAKHSGRNLVCA